MKVLDLLSQTCQIDSQQEQQVVVYDQCSTSAHNLPRDCFLEVLLQKLIDAFASVALLRGQCSFVLLRGHTE